MKGSEELKIDFGPKVRRDLGEVDSYRRQGRQGVLPQVLRGRRSCLRRTKGLLRHAFSECEIWAYKVPKRSVGTKDRPLDRAHPIPFRGMVLLRKCLESHHSSKLSDELPCEGERRAKIDSARRFLVETWGKWTLTVAKGDRESSPKS